MKRKKCIYDKSSILSCITHPWPIFPGLWHPQLWLCKQGDYYTGSSQLNARDTSWSWSTENLKLSWNWWPDQNLGHSKQEMLLCLSPILPPRLLFNPWRWSTSCPHRHLKDLDATVLLTPVYQLVNFFFLPPTHDGSARPCSSPFTVAS